MRHDIGVDNIMWGSDYPHIEGSHPFTNLHLRLTFGGLPVDEVTKMLTTNVADVYKFDIDALAPLAAEHCMTKAEVAEPIEYSLIPDEAQKCPGMQPHTQVQPVG